jgi:Cu(I)/Ag(I) efflux system membrane protein CusA/SilA
VLVVLLHVRVSLIIAVTLPLAALASFALMWLLRVLGIAEIPTNVMSLAGIAISIGVLVDSSIVMAEGAMHALREHFGDRPVRGDVRGIVLRACRGVGRPIFFSVVIMLLSFLPVFALGGMEGKMFRPLALTKCFALLAVAVLSITLVPALCTIFIRGRLRGELDSPIVRGVIEVYRPVLASLLDRPAPLVGVLAVTFLVGLTPVGSRPLFLATLFAGLVAVGLTARRWPGRLAGLASLLVIALVADRNIEPLGREFMTPLDEGMVMDMPISVPRASVVQSGDDVKARDMILCRFPEVDMVVGKAGRAETPTDPAPLDMIETMVNFRPREFWPRRKLMPWDAERQTAAVYEALVARGLLAPPPGAAARATLLDEVTRSALTQFDALMREYGYQRNQELMRSLAIDPARIALDGPDAEYLARWRDHVRRLDAELLERGAATYTRLAIEELLALGTPRDPALSAHIAELKRLRNNPEPPRHHHQGGGGGHAMSRLAERPATLAPQPALDVVQDELSKRFERRLILWKKDRADLVGFGGELDRAVPMPGWTNVWTMPIQNRVDMLATGVNTAIGVRVLGRNLDDVVRASGSIAAALKRLPGAADVVADPIRGKGYLDVTIDRAEAARRGVSVADVNDAVETAIGGKVVTTALQGRERHPVRVRYGRDWREDEESVRDVLVASRAEPGPPRLIPLSEVADVTVGEGPATIKSENGLLRNYVRLNVRGRSVGDFVDDARALVAERVRLPEGTYVEWTGQFEHELRARRTLRVIVPIVLALILLVLYATFRDLADAVLMMLAVPGAVAGGVFFQWLLGYPFSVTVWVGYIACFGMATSTGIIMLVYLRQSVERSGGVENLSLDGLRRAVLDGAVYRLRPKLLTEGTTILGLAPMLWAGGVGAEVIRPMAAPVLGGILIADEVIDLFLPVVFYWLRRRRWERLHRTDPAADPADEHDAVAVKLTSS